jgi:cell division protein FtsQ
MIRLKNIALFSILMLYVIVMSGTISDTRKHLLCNGINVIITNSTESGFMTRDDIVQIVSGRTNSLGKPVNEIDLKEIERILLESRAIKTAQCYVTEDGKLHIYVTCRKPVVRIMDSNNRGYYLDKEGNIFQLSEHFSPNVLIANGKIRESFDLNHTRNIYMQYPDHVSKSNRVICDLLILVNHINQSDFWRAQFEQIYVNEKYEFELIPRIGAHIILFGNINDYEEKLDNLKTLYIEGFNKSGWNDYVFINLKFKNQIICSKR